MNTITTPNSAHRIAKIIAEIRSTCIEDVDAEVIEEILLHELNEYCILLAQYYAEEHSNAVSSARCIAYDDGYDYGHSEGYSEGYYVGYSDCHS